MLVLGLYSNYLPRTIASPAPTRVSTASRMAIVASLHGTKEPIWAITTQTAIYLKRSNPPWIATAIGYIIVFFLVHAVLFIIPYTTNKLNLLKSKSNFKMSLLADHLPIAYKSIFHPYLVQSKRESAYSDVRSARHWPQNCLVFAQLVDDGLL